MARPIKETPILKGKDAQNFVAKMKNIKPVSAQKKAEMKHCLEQLRSIANFDL